MLEAVEQCIDQGLALKQLVPVRVVEVGGDTRRLSGVTQIHELEEGVDLFVHEGQIAELVDMQDILAGEAVEQSRGGAVRQRGVELIEQNMGLV